ncbi:two-component system sensor histidine kinase UhpB [Nocardioides luteus]|uniref:histidine kinase n=1 Tax=Nocardioides luteus TaxID=1844 RepID=A0ABQ5SWU1_9ACTN|nr:sensor histidine kinase [Nocardioides luteus]MDR7311726.1 two-component system sensor histidine kinase UhpB [Nocardioides luteus]GGR66361.1 histidine kinase [Nocardioides luteus]GLJ67967.1 histidine kinase [Nocardioides luteus]
MSHLPLYWRVCLTNGTLFCIGTLVLALSPARVSERVLASEAIVLAVGLTVMATLNGLLLLRSLGPIDRVIRTMDAVDHLSPEQRLTAEGEGPGARLVASYNAMLERLETERSTSNAKALAAQEAERHRIAQELHDEVGQSLTVVLLGLKSLESQIPEELRPDLAAVRESARTGIDDVRRVARQLRPGVLEDLGLHAALAALATDVSAVGRTTVRRTTGRGIPDLPQDRELVVYRVAQEALTNVVRHANAATAELSLCKVGDQVVLTVSDDGRGVADLVPGAGISGMRERALLVGAELSVTSEPGRGTTVRLEVPL